MDSSFRSFLWFWIGLVIIGFGGIWAWRIRINPIAAWTATFQYLYVVDVLPIMKHPQISFLVITFPPLTLYVFFKLVRINKPSDDFILSITLQEAQGLWLGLSLGFFFFFISTATTSDPTLNQAQDTSAFASFILTWLLYAWKRRTILRFRMPKPRT